MDSRYTVPPDGSREVDCPQTQCMREVESNSQRGDRAIRRLTGALSESGVTDSIIGICPDVNGRPIRAQTQIRYAEIMIRVICGDDEFAVSNALEERLAKVASPDLRDANVTTFDASNTMLAQVIDTARAVPFMSDRRAIVVKNMLTPLEDRTSKVRGDWGDLGKVMTQDGLGIPNELIFVDYAMLRLAGPNLKPLAAVAEVERYSAPKRADLERWIRERAAFNGLTISARGMARFIALAGDNTRRIDSELRKLAVYADGRPLDERDIELMVSDAHQEGIFRVVDAIINRQAGEAMAGLNSLIQSGDSIDGILFLLSRQLRQLVMASDLMMRGVPRQEIGNRLNLRFAWMVDKTVRQANSSGHQRLKEMHRSVLEVDFSTKTGQADRKLLAELMIARLASL